MRNIIIIPLDCQIVLFVPGDKNGMNIYYELISRIDFLFKKKENGKPKNRNSSIT